MIEKFDDLPQYLQIYLKKLYEPVNYDYKSHVLKKIPDLGDKSIIQTMNEISGEEKIIKFLNEGASLYGGPYLLKKPGSNA